MGLTEGEMDTLPERDLHSLTCTSILASRTDSALNVCMDSSRLLVQEPFQVGGGSGGYKGGDLPQLSEYRITDVVQNLQCLVRGKGRLTFIQFYQCFEFSADYAPLLLSASREDCSHCHHPPRTPLFTTFLTDLCVVIY